ncbi:MAG: PIG-L deacetylase family protein [Methanosarcinaceae archaeon]
MKLVDKLVAASKNPLSSQSRFVARVLPVFVFFFFFPALLFTIPTFVFDKWLQLPTLGNFPARIISGEVLAELECACRALGIEPPRFLDYRDGTLFEVNEEQAIGQVVHIIRELRPQALLTWPHSGISGHPDRVAVSYWAEKAFQQATNPKAYPEHQSEGLHPHAAEALYHIVIPYSLAEALKMRHLSTVPDETVTHTVDVSAVWDTKMAAIRCHRSQMGSPPILESPEEKRRLFLGTEYFRLVSGQI